MLIESMQVIGHIYLLSVVHYSRDISHAHRVDASDAIHRCNPSVQSIGGGVSIGASEAKGGGMRV